MAPQDSLLKVYGDRSYTHVTMARHQGTTVAFAMDSSRRIVYSVLDLAGDKGKGGADAAFWGVNPIELAFPRELAEVGYAVVGPTAMPVVKRGGVEAAVDEQPTAGETDLRLSTTARLTASAPFHVISDGTYVVVLRQSIGDAHPDAVYKLTGAGCSGNASRTDYVLDGTKKVPLVRDTLLCDRFVLVEGKLKPVLEVRYRRSRHATRSESTKDTLGTEDMEGRPFYEPTQELSFIRNLSQGRFAAVLVPTAVNNVQRWQFFAHNDATGRVDCFNVEQGVRCAPPSRSPTTCSPACAAASRTFSATGPSPGTPRPRAPRSCATKGCAATTWPSPRGSRESCCPPLRCPPTPPKCAPRWPPSAPPSTTPSPPPPPSPSTPASSSDPRARPPERSSAATATCAAAAGTWSPDTRSAT